MVEMATGYTPLAAVCATMGASYVRVMHEGNWPLARLTNVAGRMLRGKASHFVKLDVDGLLGPLALRSVQKVVRDMPYSVVSLRPRRLPEGAPPAPWRYMVRLAEDHGDHRTWGMCMTHNFDAFERLRGHGEDFDSWGFEDNNYVHRASVRGYPTIMLDTDPPSLLHQWHLPVDGSENEHLETLETSNSPLWGTMTVLEETWSPRRSLRRM